MNNTDTKEEYRINDDELDKVSGGVVNASLCACGRGYIYKDGLCKKCYELKENK